MIDQKKLNSKKSPPGYRVEAQGRRMDFFTASKSALLHQNTALVLFDNAIKCHQKNKHYQNIFELVHQKGFQQFYIKHGKVDHLMNYVNLHCN